MREDVDLHGTMVVVKRVRYQLIDLEYKEKIAAYAISLTKAWGAEMTALHVVEPRHALSNSVESEAKEQARIDESKRQAENLLNEIAILAKKQGLNIKKEVIQPSDLLAKEASHEYNGGNYRKSGSVGKRIIDYAEKNNIDVIVMGTKGMSAVEEYFFGIVANKVIHEALCPVFAIR